MVICIVVPWYRNHRIAMFRTPRLYVSGQADIPRKHTAEFIHCHKTSAFTQFLDKDMDDTCLYTRSRFRDRVGE